VAQIAGIHNPICLSGSPSSLLLDASNLPNAPSRWAHTRKLLTMASSDEKEAISSISPVSSTVEKKAEKRARRMATIQDDDERLLNQIGYTQACTIPLLSEMVYLTSYRI
jgi:hypothetical protein